MRIVFVLAEYSLHNHIVTDYLRARPDDEVAVVKVPLVLKGKDRVTTARRIVPRLSRRFLVGKIVEGLVVLAITIMPKLMRRGAIFMRLRRIARRHGLPFHKTTNIMAPETLAFVREQRPDFVVTLFHQIVKRELIEIPARGVINIHPGLIPEFRGIQPYFWELSEGSLRAGPTLHFIEDETIDTGRVVARASYPVQPRMSVQLNYYLTSKLAAQLLPGALGRSAQPQATDEGNYYRWPDSAAFDRLKARGHSLFSWRQLWGILAGRYDEEVSAPAASSPSDTAAP